MIGTNTVVLLGTIAREPQAAFLASGAQEVSREPGHHHGSQSDTAHG